MGIFMSLQNSKKRNLKKEEEYGDIPFGGTPKDILIDFKCKRCGYEEKVPDFVAFECYTEEDFDEESGSPIVLCPECDSNMIIKK